MQFNKRDLTNILSEGKVVQLKPYVLASGLEGIISQRLVRRICTHCSESDRVDTTILQQLGPLFANNQKPLFKGKGCEHCANSGYHGRLCLIELLIPNEEMRDLIAGQAGQGIWSLKKWY